MPLACSDAGPGDRPAPEEPRIVAIGDLHGDLDAARRALRLAGAIDETDHWAGGRLTLVQTGDILDRGGDEQAILDLFERLRHEAAEAGGAVHVLNGNHEALNVSLDFRYVTSEGFADFRDAVTVPPDDPQLAEYPEEQRARVVAFRPGGPYARLLADHPVALLIDETVFVHGGLLPHYAQRDPEALSAELRDWMLGLGPRPGWARGSDSPLWSRHYSDDADSADCDSLDAALARLSAARMVVGHTVQDSVTAYCDDRVWCIDTGMASYYHGEIQVLEITPGGIRALREPPPPREGLARGPDHSR